MTVTAATATLPSGLHRIDVTVDGTALFCTFMFPLETPSTSALTSAQCSLGLTTLVGPTYDCTTFEDGGAQGQRCVANPDQLEERIQIPGTPAVVQVTQSVGGTVILQQTATPTYHDSQPNGPGCEPICRQATAAWSIP